MATADALKDQGIQQFRQQDYEQAADTFRQAIAQYEADGVGDMAAEMQVNLGLALHMLSRHEAALEQMNMAHAVFAQLNDTSRTAQVLGNMARVYAKMGNTEQAITNYREASARFMELGDEENYGQTVMAIADLQLRSGKAMQAAATYEVGLEYVKQPNARQRLMKRLLSMRDKISGTGIGQADDES